MSICLTGIKPTGKTRLGNYFGMMKPLIDLSLDDSHEEVYIFVANYHALNSTIEAGELRDQTRSMALDLIASGLDTDRVTFFYQSDVPELTELTWIFNNLVTVSYLERSHAYKDAVANGKEANMGLFDYPVLMAADILAYGSTVVPVGQDQKQHVEIAQKVYQKFHHHFGEAFAYPQPQISETVGVLPGLDGRKMSKSYGNTIELYESEETTAKKVMKITTDSKRPEEPKDPDNCTLMTLYRLVGKPEAVHYMESRYREGGVGYKEIKETLAEAMNYYLRPMRTRYAELQSQPEYIDTILRQGGLKARSVAQERLKKVRELVGIV